MDHSYNHLTLLRLRRYLLPLALPENLAICLKFFEPLIIPLTNCLTFFDVSSTLNFIKMTKSHSNSKTLKYSSTLYPNIGKTGEVEVISQLEILWCDYSLPWIRTPRCMVMSL